MGIPTILLLQIVVDLEQKRREGKIKEYIDGVIEVVALESNKSIEDVKKMNDDEFMQVYASIKKRIEDESVMSKVVKFFQSS